MPSPVQSNTVSVLLVTLLQTTRAARIKKHDAHCSSTSQLNQSTAEKEKLWQKIDELMGQGVQLRDDSEVQGTLGRAWKWEKNFEELVLDANDPSIVVFDIGAAQNPYVSFSRAFSYRDSEVLLLQGESANKCCEHLMFEDQLKYKKSKAFNYYSHNSEFLKKFLEPSGSTFGDLKLSLNFKIFGHKKKGLWHGTLPGAAQKPLTTTTTTEFHDRVVPPHHSQDPWAAWKLACPKGPTKVSSMQKMIIPLEYNSFNAVKGLDETNGKAGKYFEVLHESDANSPMAFVELKRLLSYRSGLLYLKYHCRVHSENYFDQLDPTIWIEKVSLMIKHASKETYSVPLPGVVKQGYPSYPTGPRFLAQDNV